MKEEENSRTWDLEAGLEAGFGRSRRAGLEADSVLTSLARFLAGAPKVLLRDDEPSAGPPLRKTSAEASSALPQGRGSYQILGELARGGMGVVLKGHDEDLGRDVAMKVLHPEFCGRPESVQRFVEEAQIGGQLQHPGIVPVYELGLMADERPYFTMKLIKGRTLSSILAERGAVGTERRRFLTIFEQVCQTMAYAHSRGVIHRDLKPSNVMVGAFGEVQVVDWGLAKVLAHGGTADERREKESFSAVTVLETVRSGDGSSHSRAGSVMGTPAYMSPEQARGEVSKVDERADVFSLGAILCQLLTGKPPYVGDGPTTMALAAAAELDDANARLEACEADPDLVKLARSCMAPAPAARPRNAEAVARAIQAYLANAEERAHQAEIAAAEARVKVTAERRSRRLTMALAATVVAATFAGGAGYLGYEAREQERRDRLTSSIQSSLEEAVHDQGRGDLAAALSSVARADSLAGQGDVGDELRSRIATLRGTIESTLARHRAEEELASKNATLFAALERASMLELHEFLEERRAAADPHSPDPTSEDAGETDYDQWKARDETYGEAFWDYGLVFEPLDEESLTASILASGEAERIAVYLDDWARVRRRSGKNDSARQLSALARRIDPDPWRGRLRDALDTDDEAAMLVLAEAADVDALPALSFFLLGNALEEQPAAAVELLQRAVRRYPGDFQVRYQLARALRKVEPSRYAEALCQLEACRALRPRSVLALAEKAYVLRKYHREDEPGASVEIARQAVAIDAENTFARRQLAWSLWYAGSQEEALTEVEEAARRDPASPWAMNDFAWMLWKSGDFEGAEIEARDLTQEHPEFVGGFRTLADVLWFAGKHDQAVLAYQKAAEASSDNQNVFADSLRLTGRAREAIELYEKCIEREPRNGQHYHDLMMAYDELGRPDLALEVLDNDFDCSNPADLETHRGGLLMELGRFEEARQVLERAVEIPVENPLVHGNAHSNLVECCLEAGRVEDALRHGRKAVEIDPDDPRYAQNLAFALRASGQFEEALALVDRALRTGLDEQARRIGGRDEVLEEELITNRAAILVELKRFEEALEACETAMAKGMESSNLVWILSCAKHATGDFAACESLRWEYFDRVPNPGTIELMAFGKCLREHGENPRASRDFLERAIALDPGLAEAHHQLGHTFEMLGDPEAAADAYREGLRLNPGDAHYREMLLSVLPPDAPEAVELAQGLKDDPPEDAAVLNNLAWNLVKDPESSLFDPSRAVELARRAVELEPEHPYLWNTVGLALLRTGSFQEAIEACGRSIQLAGEEEYAEDWYVIALAQQALGRSKEAREALARARELDTTTQEEDPDRARLAAEARGSLGE